MLGVNHMKEQGKLLSIIPEQCLLLSVSIVIDYYRR